MPFLLKVLPTLHFILGFLLAALTLAFLMRIIITWYPKIDLNKGLWLFIYWPTEPFLSITRNFVPAIGGVDVTPVIWLGLISLSRELLVGQQGVISQILVKSHYLS
tara:strand:+ start:107 stop:424 length:318 start_codon:yes stop_codon:yes gene_type:complete